jgi:hypothetical protein
MAKNIVKYVEGSLFYFGVGKGAIVEPINHPDTDNVSNTKPVLTSNVVDINLATGWFETENSIYIPVTAFDHQNG